MRKYQDDGILRSLEDFWFKDTCKNLKILNEGSVSVLSVAYFRGLFAIGLTWIGMSSIIFAFEYLIGWVKRLNRLNTSLMESSPAQSLDSIEQPQHVNSDITKIFKR